jgi:hypothetical protein
MALAFRGAKYLFSILQHVLVDQHGPRLKLTPLVKQALQDWAALATQLHAYPVPIHTLVPGPPHYLTAVDASKTGMGGFWLPTSIMLDAQPCVWRARFPMDIVNQLISATNPRGSITNSDLELAAIVTGASTLAASVPPYRHLCIAIATDNTPALAWSQKGSTSSIAPPAYLLRELAQQCRAGAFDIMPRFTPGSTNTVADCCSRSFHLSDDDFLTLIQRLHPVQPPWKLVTPPAHLTLQMNYALSRQMRPLVSPAAEPVPTQPLGTFGQTSASASTVTQAWPTSMIPSHCYKSSLTDIASASWLPAALQSELARWKEPFVPWARRWPHWAAPTHAYSHPENSTYASTASYPPIPKLTHPLIVSNQCPYLSSPTQPNTAFAPTPRNLTPSQTCSSWVSSSSSALASMHIHPALTRAPFASVTYTSSSMTDVSTLTPAPNTNWIVPQRWPWNLPTKKMESAVNSLASAALVTHNGALSSLSCAA